MSEWHELRLGDALRVKHGYAFPGAGFGNDPTSPQVLTPGHFATRGGFQDAKPKSFDGSYPPEYLLDSGETVITMTDLSKAGDTLGYAARLPKGRNFLHNQRIGLITITNTARLNRKYFEYFTHTKVYRDYILGTASGSTVRHTSPSRIQDFTGLFPPVPEQQAIAEVLGALDDKIAANIALAGAAERLAVTQLQRVRATVPLAELVALSKATVDPANLGEETVDHFSLPAFDNDQMPVVESASGIKSNKFRVDGEMVLLSKLNPRFPRVWRANPTDGRRALASTEFLALRSIGVSPALLWAALAQPSFATALDAKVAGTSGSHQRVKPSDALQTHVIDPRILGENEASGIDAGLRIASGARAENRTLAATRDALLPQLVSGTLRVRDAEAVASAAGAGTPETEEDS